ncbi:5,6-dimethylbenzimidazole synthase [Rhizosaccharibacter radicis]|uniref:5,6-dimethylbenzimidazole synthase n=1 Tax=Rhizosaccharibacter radicis TaxID=2782605 RepID=A0ABT1VY89_9PROT|nr:5,6-dimethylbenzimidazole synthase [Acetobacteraceae bacterium KSS12]
MTPPEFGQQFREELHALFRWRRDVRRFRPDPLPPGALERLVEVAALSPSVGLSEPWRFVSVEDAATRRAVREIFLRCNEEARAAQSPERRDRYAALKLAGLDLAPCQLALFVQGDPAQGHGLGRRTMPDTVAYSAVTALHTIWLAARAEGIGLGWVSILQPDEVAAALSVPPDWRLIAYCCLGYPERWEDVPELEREGWSARNGAAIRLHRR